MTNHLHGGSAPKPPEFSALGESRGAGKRRAESISPAPPSSPHLGARVALQRGLILRVGKIIISLSSKE